MNGFQLPYPGQCYENIYTQACAEAMRTECVNVSTDGSGRSKLVTPSSNCNLWRNLYNVQYDAGITGFDTLIQYVDEAIVNYCLSNQFANECNCLNFPLRMRQQCEFNAVDCPSVPDHGYPSCNGKRFVRDKGAYEGDEVGVNDLFIQIAFNTCTPHFCWHQECWQPDQLIPSWMRDRQRSGCASEVCMSVKGQSTISIDYPTPPAGTGSFIPSFFLLDQCGAYDPAAPFDPSIAPYTVNLPVDTIPNLPYVLSSHGVGTTLTLVSSSTEWAYAPPLIAVGNHVHLFTVTIDQPKLLVSYNNWVARTGESYTTISTSSKYPQPTFVYSYQENGGKMSQWTFALDMVLQPPTGNTPGVQPITIPVIPKQTYFFVYGCLAFFVLIWILTTIRN